MAMRHLLIVQKQSAVHGVGRLTYAVGVGLSPVAIAVALCVLRCERALEAKREPVERGGGRSTARPMKQ
jgi:hypothetical protein